jgi:hypothetical protein
VLVSVTDFRAASRRDLPGIYRAGLRLRQEWPRLPGAVGMWLWTAPGQRRCGSVSVWQDEQAMYGFVALPDHVRIMRCYRDRGEIGSALWTEDRADQAAIWTRARLHLAGAGTRHRPDPS